MIKKTFAILLLSFFSSSLFSQGKIEGGFYAEYFQLGDRSFNDFGGMLHVPIGERVTLNYHIGFGTSLNGGIFVHSTGGAVAGFWILNQLEGQSLRVGYLSFLLCLIPEGVGFYLPSHVHLKTAANPAGGIEEAESTPKFLTHLSINPLSVEYFYKSQPYQEWGKMGCDVVARFKMHTSLKFPTYIAPQIAGTFIYTPGKTTGRFGLKAGVTIGFEGKD